jgi:hypothetical protein
VRPREALNADECIAFDHGAVDFISKSRDRQVLVRRLRNVVEIVAAVPELQGLRTSAGRDRWAPAQVAWVLLRRAPTWPLLAASWPFGSEGSDM